MLAAHLYGYDEHMPSQWEPYVNRFIAGAEARIARDQLRGQAPDDIPARVAAQALCAMVERHLTIEVIRNGRDMREAVRQLTELWFRAVYAGGGDGQRRRDKSDARPVSARRGNLAEQLA